MTSQKCTTPIKETFVREGHKEKGKGKVNKVVSGKATRGMPTPNKPQKFMPPSYVLHKTKDGEVYAHLLVLVMRSASMLFGFLRPL
jgi:hypothetical protein